MTSPDNSFTMEGSAFPWILEHLLSYPGTYEIPLRTMYTLNVSTQNLPQNHQRSSSSSSRASGNAFPRPPSAQGKEPKPATTATAAAQLRANLLQHITQLPSQPASLPPSFIAGFVRRCFPHELDQVDFPQALTALDYLKDLEVRRRRELVAALDKLGIAREDFGQREKLAKKYPGVIRWLVQMEEKERKVESLYTQVYIGIRRWAMINELSLTPFNKQSSIALLNTLYPPTTINPAQFVQPTTQLTPTLLSNQRNGFFRYLTAVEKNSPTVLSSLMEQHRRGEELTGWPFVKDTLESYLLLSIAIIDECYEITGAGISPTAASFASMDLNEDSASRRKVDSAISLGSNDSSNRNSAQSHNTRPSTSSSFSTHSRKYSKEKYLLDGAENAHHQHQASLSPKSSGSALERIARELRKIKSRSNMRDEHRAASKHASQSSQDDVMMQGVVSSAAFTAAQQTDSERPRGRSRGLSIKRSLRNMRSSSNVRDQSTSRPSSRAGEEETVDVPAFDAEEMKRKRERWEATQQKFGRGEIVGVASR